MKVGFIKRCSYVSFVVTVLVVRDGGGVGVREGTLKLLGHEDY